MISRIVGISGERALAASTDALKCTHCLVAPAVFGEPCWHPGWLSHPAFNFRAYLVPVGLTPTPGVFDGS